MIDPNPAAQRSNKIGLKYKIILYVVAWIGALFSANPDGGLWSLAYMFPLGLAAFINLRWGNDGGWGVLWACLAVYLVHAWFYFRSRHTRSTLLMLAVLILLFAMNVPGCRAMIGRH
jgi:hypothetical protein